MSTDQPAGSGATRGLLQIGDVAERSGLSLRTVRYYEEVGLLQPADRSPGGFRLYTEAAVERLMVIKRMKPLEFSLEQMRELLSTIDQLAQGPTARDRRELLATVESYQQLVAERLGVLRQRMLDAKALESSLDELLLELKQPPSSASRERSSRLAAPSPVLATEAVVTRQTA